MMDYLKRITNFFALISRTFRPYRVGAVDDGKAVVNKESPPKRITVIEQNEGFPAENTVDRTPHQNNVKNSKSGQTVRNDQVASLYEMSEEVFKKVVEENQRTAKELVSHIIGQALEKTNNMQVRKRKEEQNTSCCKEVREKTNRRKSIKRFLGRILRIPRVVRVAVSRVDGEKPLLKRGCSRSQRRVHPTSKEFAATNTGDELSLCKDANHSARNKNVGTGRTVPISERSEADRGSFLQDNHLNTREAAKMLVRHVMKEAFEIAIHLEQSTVTHGHKRESSINPSMPKCFSSLKQRKRKKIIKGVAIAGGGILGAAIAPVAVVGALGAVGFNAGGVAAGSAAAAIQSSVGNVAAGSIFAMCQSIGAAGLGAAGTATSAAGGAGAFAGAAAFITNRFSRKKNDKSTQTPGSGLATTTMSIGSDKKVENVQRSLLSIH